MTKFNKCLFYCDAVLTWEEKKIQTQIKPLKPYFISGKAGLSEMAAVWIPFKMELCGAVHGD